MVFAFAFILRIAGEAVEILGSLVEFLGGTFNFAFCFFRIRVREALGGFLDRIGKGFLRFKFLSLLRRVAADLGRFRHGIREGFFGSGQSSFHFFLFFSRLFRIGDRLGDFHFRIGEFFHLVASLDDRVFDFFGAGGALGIDGFSQRASHGRGDLACEFLVDLFFQLRSDVVPDLTARFVEKRVLADVIQTALDALEGLSVRLLLKFSVVIFRKSGDLVFP